jgi:hypothetical protein
MTIKAWQCLFPVVTLTLLAYQFLSGQSGGPSNFNAKLVGANEVPAVSTKGSGEFRGTLQSNGTEIAFELEYADLSGPATMAHIHFGQRFATGGVMVHLCGTGGTAACPGSAGKVAGLFGASRVVDVAAQGISAGEFAELLAALRAGNAYVNVHTAQSPQGEIRGQVRPGRGVGGDDNEEDEEGKGKGKGKGKSQGN